MNNASMLASVGAKLEKMMLNHSGKVADKAQIMTLAQTAKNRASLTKLVRPYF